jgi:hypothetical protein
MATSPPKPGPPAQGAFTLTVVLPELDPPALRTPTEAEQLACVGLVPDEAGQEPLWAP